MSELERLEQDEDIRIRGILDGLRGLGQGNLNGAPDILQRMVNYCMQMRNEHDVLLQQNERLSQQNGALISVVNQFDGKIAEANNIIASFRVRYMDLEAKYDNLENAYNRLRIEEEEKRRYLEGVLNKCAIKLAEYKYEADHNGREADRIHSHYRGQIGRAAGAHNALADQVRALTQNLGLDFNVSEFISSQRVGMNDLRFAQELLIIEGEQQDSNGERCFDREQARQIAKQIVMLSGTHGSTNAPTTHARDAGALVDANW